MVKEFELKDSGKREEFTTGSRRDTREGKGRYDLISPIALTRVMKQENLITDINPRNTNEAVLLGIYYAYAYQIDFDWKRIYTTARLFLEAIQYQEDEKYSCFLTSSFPEKGIIRLAKWYELGSKKYSERNWELGQGLARYFDSGCRHAFYFLDKKEDEDHLAAAVWNFFAIIHTKNMLDIGKLPKELDNMPTVFTVFKEQKISLDKPK